MGLRVELVDGERNEDNGEYDGRIENEFFDAAARLIIAAVATAQKAGHAGRALLQKNECNDGDRENDLNNSDGHNNRGKKFLYRGVNNEVDDAHHKGCKEERRNGLYDNTSMKEVNMIRYDRQ